MSNKKGLSKKEKEKSCKWIESKKGRKAIRRALKRAEKMSRELAEARKIK